MEKLVAILAIMAILASLLPGCTTSPEKQLKEMGYEVNAQSFLACVMSGRSTVVRLFLEAGISPDTRNETGLPALMLAVQGGHTDVVRVLLEGKADVNAATEEGLTPLLFAIEAGLLEICKVLIEAKADVDAVRVSDGYTALHIAATQFPADAGRMLLEAGASPNIVSRDGTTPLMIAVRSGYSTYYGIILRDGRADLNIARTSDGYTALHIAIDRGDRDACRALLDAGADPNIKSHDGTTPLMISHFINPIYRVTELLLESGASIDAQNALGKTALMILASTNSLAHAYILIESGADLDIKSYDGRTALEYANSSPVGEFLKKIYAHRQVVSELLQNGGDLDAPLGVEGSAALHIAATLRDGATCRALLDAGASPDVSSHDGTTSLMIAARNGHYSLMELLLQRGAQVNTQNALGETALMLVTRLDQLHFIQLLSDNGADVSIETYSGRTALDYAPEFSKAGELIISLGGKVGSTTHKELEFIAAVKSGNVEKAREWINQGASPDSGRALLEAVDNADWEMIIMLLEEGASVDGPANKLATPLMRTASKGLVEIAELLLDMGADVNWASDGGVSAIQIAVQHNQVPMVELLLNRGTNIESKDDMGNTPLIWAAYDGHLEMVKLLISKGANVNAKTEWPFPGAKTPLIAAEQNSHTEVVKALKAAGAK